MNKKILLTTLNCKYIHKNLALRWLYVSSPYKEDIILKEFTIKEKIDDIVNEILNLQVDIICFSVYIWNIEETLAIVSKLKADNNNMHIIVGGPEVTYDSFDLINQGIDAITLGEGEISTWEYISMLNNNESYEVKGIYTKEYPNKEIQKMDLKYNESLDNPYFLDMDKNEMKNRYFYFETSRGCPYHCAYCLSSTDNNVRLFSEDYIFDILEKIAKSDIKIVKLLDRTFNIKPLRALKIARYMNEHCKNQIFQFEVVAETISDELLDFFLYEADKKRFRLEVGVQSFNSKTLTSVGRIQNNERLCEVIKKLQSAHIVMHTDLIAGLPFEGYNSFKVSFNSLFELHTDEIQLGILKLLKGTKLKKEKDIYGLEYNASTPYDVTKTPWLSEEEMNQIHQIAHAVEKYYNNGRMRYSIDTIIELGLYSDAFRLFYEIGKRLAALKKPYPMDATFLILKDVLKDEDDEIVNGLIYYDYYRINKHRPKRILGNTISKEKRKEIEDLFISKNLINIDKFYHYGHIDVVYYNNKVGYQIVIYNENHTYPIRYFSDGNIVEEMQ